MSEPAELAMARMEACLHEHLECQNVSFRFELPEKGLAFRSARIEEGVAKLSFDASDCEELSTITEKEVATIVRLVLEGKRPEFFYIAIPPGHPFHERQYMLYSPAYLRGTMVGDVFAKIDWEMKCLTIGAKTDEAKTEFWDASLTSKLEGRLGTVLNFPSTRSSGSVKISCKSIKVEETDDECIFVGEPELQIINDTSPDYTKYINSVLDRVAHHDQPLFLKLKEYIKLIKAVEMLKEKGVTFDKKWYMGLTTKKTESQAVQVQHGNSNIPTEFEFNEVIKYLPPDIKVEKKTKTGLRCVSKDGQSTFAMSVNDYDFLYDGFDPKQPLGCIDEADGLIVPDVDSWSELYRETVPWPRVWVMPGKGGVRTAGGGVTTSRIPTSHVPCGTSTKHSTQMHQTPKRNGLYERSGNGISVTSSNVPSSASTRAPPKGMIPQRENPQRVPSKVVGPRGKQSSAAAKPFEQSKYGYQDGGSLQMHDKSGKNLLEVGSMKGAVRRNVDGEETGMFVQFPTIVLQSDLAELGQDGVSDTTGDCGVLSPSDAGDDMPSRFQFCSPIGSDDEMD